MKIKLEPLKNIKEDYDGHSDIFIRDFSKSHTRTKAIVIGLVSIITLVPVIIFAFKKSKSEL